MTQRSKARERSRWPVVAMAALLTLVTSLVLQLWSRTAFGAETPSTVLDTPRRTYDAFVEAARRHDWTRAAETLDVHAIPAAERKARSVELAAQLYTVF